MCTTKNLFKTAMLALLTSLCGVPAAAQDLKVEPLANDNFIIRIAPDTKEQYLILPIEESAPESQVKVIVDNVQMRQLNIRLAQNKVDYCVPFDLKEFDGKHIVLFTHANIDHASRNVGSEIFLKNLSLSDTFDTTNREKFRPDYHHTPAYGWMNDPNGMFYKDGEWHLCYQFGPYGSMWNNLTWGHSVSKDLIHWEHRKPVLSPDAHGAIFSGSCIVDKNNTAGFGKDAIIAMYTSAGDVQSQSIAYSLDNGDTFHVYEGNPVLTAEIADFRDPNMFWNEDTKRWTLIMSASQEMRIYSSPDMKHWTEESRFGRTLGSHEGVWECPDLMKLKVETGKTKGQERWVLICNINPGGPAGGSATQYFIGNFDGHKFTVDSESRYDGKALWQDYGKDHYAAVSFSDAPNGRHTMIAWMSNWQYANNVPTMQYRAANSIAREPFLYEGKDYTDPKHPSAAMLYLGSHPSPEYDGQGLDRKLNIKGSCKITLSNDEGEEFVITYDEKAMTLSADRSKSGLTDFSQDFSVLATAPVHKKLTSMRIFIDNSSVEVFGNNGEVCLTSLVFPQSKYNKITLNK
jgi:fructan beta-fructosidase